MCPPPFGSFELLRQLYLKEHILWLLIATCSHEFIGGIFCIYIINIVYSPTVKLTAIQNPLFFVSDLVVKAIFSFGAELPSMC
jgi:hypothetical protein